MTERVMDAIRRVSRKAGRKGDAFMSPAEQEDAINRCAAANGVRIAKWWDETDSVSGGTVDRQGLQAAIARATAGKIDGILVAKVDRFARTVQGGLSAINTLEDAGKELWSAREGVIVGDVEATATDKLIRTFWLMLAQWQRDTLTEGWEAVRHRHIANGIHTVEPYGYRKDETRRLVPDPKESPWVPRIFEHRADGDSWYGIAEWLNEQDAPTRNGGRWAYTSVRNIVTSRVYLGEITSGVIVNESAHAPLVDRVLWERANRLAKTPKRRDAEPFLCAGFVRCAGCGVRMNGRTDVKRMADGREQTYRYYRCNTRHSFGRCAAPARVRAEELDSHVLAEFERRFLSGKGIGAAQSTADLEAATAALAQAENDLREFLTSESTDELRRTLGQTWVDEGTNARMARIVQAREDVAAARNAALGVEFPADLADLWGEMGTEDRRSFLAQAFSVVAVVGTRGDIAGRVGLSTRDDPTAPDDLPGPGNFVAARPLLLVHNGEVVAGVAAA